MFIGADKALLTTDITTGARHPEVMCKTSCIKANPAEAVAVKALAPVAAAVKHAVNALCSDSTQTNSVSTSPLATYSLNRSTIMV